MPFITTGLTNGGITPNFAVTYNSVLTSVEPARANSLLAVLEQDLEFVAERFVGVVINPAELPISIQLDQTTLGWNASWSLIGGKLNILAHIGDNNLATLRVSVITELVKIFGRAQGLGWYGGVGHTEGTMGAALALLLADEFIQVQEWGRLGDFYGGVTNEWLNTGRENVIATPSLDYNTILSPEVGGSLLYLFYLKTQCQFKIPNIVSSIGQVVSTCAQQLYTNLTGSHNDPFYRLRALADQAFPGTGTISSGDLNNPFPLFLTGDQNVYDQYSDLIQKDLTFPVLEQGQPGSSISPGQPIRPARIYAQVSQQFVWTPVFETSAGGAGIPPDGGNLSSGEFAHWFGTLTTTLLGYRQMEEATGVLVREAESTGIPPTADVPPGPAETIDRLNLDWETRIVASQTSTGPIALSFSVIDPIQGGVVGLTIPALQQSNGYTDILYGFLFESGKTRVVELGIPKTDYFNFDTSDKFTIETQGTAVIYRLHGDLIYVSEVPCTKPQLLAEISLYAKGDTIYDLTLNSSSNDRTELAPLNGYTLGFEITEALLLMPSANELRAAEASPLDVLTVQPPAAEALGHAGTNLVARPMPADLHGYQDDQELLERLFLPGYSALIAGADFTGESSILLAQPKSSASFGYERHYAEILLTPRTSLLFATEWSAAITPASPGAYNLALDFQQIIEAAQYFLTLPITQTVYESGVLTLQIEQTIENREEGVISLEVQQYIQDVGSLELPITQAIYNASYFQPSLQEPSNLGVFQELDATINTSGLLTIITGDIVIEAEENTARIARLHGIPTSNPVNTAAFVNAAVTIDYKGTRIFTGKIDAADYDSQSGVASLECSDRLQRHFDGADRFEALHRIRKLAGLSNPIWHPSIFSEDTTIWGMLQDAMSAIPFSMDLDSKGTLKVSPWKRDKTTTPDFRFTCEDITSDGIKVELAQNQDIINTVDLTLSFRYDRIHRRIQNYSWSLFADNQWTWSDIAHFALPMPTVDTVVSSITGTDWLLTANPIILHPNAQNQYMDILSGPGGAVYLVPGVVGVDDPMTYCVSANFTLEKRWAQQIGEYKTIRVQSAVSKAQHGSKIETLNFAVEPDMSAWFFHDVFEMEVDSTVRRFTGTQGVIDTLFQAQTFPYQKYRYPFDPSASSEGEFGQYIDVDTAKIVNNASSGQVYYEVPYTLSAWLTGPGIGLLQISSSDLLGETVTLKPMLDTVSRRYSLTFTLPRPATRAAYDFTTVAIKTEANRVSNVTLTVGSQPPPLFDLTNPNQDIPTLREYFQAAMKVAKQVAVTNIVRSHRRNYITATIPLMPTLERHHTVELDSRIPIPGVSLDNNTNPGVFGRGKVWKLTHTINLDEGIATTTVQVALNLPYGGIDQPLDTTPIGKTVQPPITTYRYVPQTIMRLGTYYGMVPNVQPPHPKYKADYSGITPIPDQYDLSTGLLLQDYGWTADSPVPETITWVDVIPSTTFYGYGDSSFTIRTPPIEPQNTYERISSQNGTIVVQLDDNFFRVNQPYLLVGE